MALSTYSNVTQLFKQDIARRIVLTDDDLNAALADVRSAVTGPPVGKTAGTVAAGDDSRILGAVQANTLASVATSGVYADLISKPAPYRLTATAIVETLAYTPYDDANPAGYQTAAQVAKAVRDGGAGLPPVGTTAGTYAAGDDPRIAGALSRDQASTSYAAVGHTHAIPASLFLPGAPTTGTAAAGTSTQQLATTAFVMAAIAAAGLGGPVTPVGSATTIADDLGGVLTDDLGNTLTEV